MHAVDEGAGEPAFLSIKGRMHYAALHSCDLIVLVSTSPARRDKIRLTIHFTYRKNIQKLFRVQFQSAVAKSIVLHYQPQKSWKSYSTYVLEDRHTVEHHSLLSKNEIF